MKKYLLLILIVLTMAPFALGFQTSDYEAVIAGLKSALVQLEAPDSHTTNFEDVHGRDPLSPLLDDQGRLMLPTALHGNFSIQGIILDAEKRTVLVDDRFYHEGDTIGNAKIVRIRSNGFLMRENDSLKTTFVPLYPDSDKREEESSSVQ